MAAWQPRLPPHVAEFVSHLPPAVKQDVKQALRVLSSDPHAGAPLQRELKGLWKYRARSFRIVYQLVTEQRVLRIVAIGHRQTVYDLVRQQQLGALRAAPRASPASPA
jgi:mRNA interferase RelE/StbE